MRRIRELQKINSPIRRTGVPPVRCLGRAGRPSYGEARKRYLFGNPLNKIVSPHSPHSPHLPKLPKLPTLATPHTPHPTPYTLPILLFGLEWKSRLWRPGLDFSFL
ncbi:MAG: hypothetical protein F6J93_12200 [Oscillatoria sp. SIO1A7]|nr:hypothetical protein [Oscillatoria sp. SIO1A7]